MLNSIEDRLRSDHNNSTKGQHIAMTSWDETVIVVVNGVAGLVASYLHILSVDSEFNASWQALLMQFRAFLSFGVLDISTAVYKALRRILAQASHKKASPAFLDKGSVEEAWQLWSKGVLPQNPTRVDPSDNQDCLLAYVHCFAEIYRLQQADLGVSQIKRMLVLLRDSILRADVASYSVDVEYLTSLQTQVLESIKMISTDVAGVPAAIISQVAEFVALAFQDHKIVEERSKRPTYIALSKASMALLGSMIITHAADKDLYEGGAMALSLQALALPISLKYSFEVTTKSTAPWQLATTTTLNVLKATIASIVNLDNPEDAENTWSAIVKIVNSITAADCDLASPTTQISIDEDFDITSFLILRDLITPTLGNASIPDDILKTYTTSLFHQSLIHAPMSCELPKPDTDILAVFHRHRKGRTIDPTPSLRKRMSYVCLQELFTLVSAKDGSSAHVRLAQAAAPYLILRVGLTIRAYVADQPLRGMMPQPLSQRMELLHVLKALVKLRCEPKSIPQLGSVVSERRKHLHRLYPLLSKMIRVAARDEEMLEWVGQALDAVGEEFEL